jgi:tetratricopeptide (TPR) repeat protein
VTREQLAFLCGGFAFGVLFGIAAAYAFWNTPDLDVTATSAELEGPRGPEAPGASGNRGGPGDAAAPMMAHINDLKRRLSEEPENVNVLVELADLHQQVAMWPQAAGFYERALAVESGHYELEVNLGLCYRGMGDYPRALAAFTRARELAPGQPEPLVNTISAAAEARDYDRALEALTALEALDPLPEGLDAARIRELREWLEKAKLQAPAAAS